MAKRPSTHSTAIRAAKSAALACACVAALAVPIVPAQARHTDSYWAAETEACRDRTSTDPRQAAELTGQNAARARESLNLGDAEVAAADPNLEVAMQYWQDAIEAGSCTGAQAAIMARKRLQMYTLTTWSTDDSLRALERELSEDRRIVNVAVFQRALRALGYYKGDLDGHLSPRTRKAMHLFQNDMAFQETDALIARQLVYLIGNAAETARDAASQTTLAFMFVKGIGVPENMDFAAAWLRRASARDDSKATFYLAILNGTGIADGHPHGCFQQNLPYADQCLKEAVRQGHKDAHALLRKYAPPAGGPYPWAQMEADPIVRDALAIFGAKCLPARPLLQGPPPLPVAKPKKTS